MGLTVVFCMILAGFEGIDLQAAGLAVPQVQHEFALSTAELGYFTAASSIGVLLGAFFGGRISDRLGRRLSLVIALALFGLASIGTALSGGFPMLMFTRFMTGVGMGAALPILIILTSENSSSEWKSRAVAIVYAGFPLGGALASWVMSAVAVPASVINSLLSHVALAGDWRSIFYLGGLAPLIAVPLAGLVMPDSAEFARARSISSAEDTVGWRRAAFGSGRTANSVLLWISFITSLLVLYLLLNWLPALLNSRGLSRRDAFLVQVALNLGGSVGSVAAGALMDSVIRQLAVPMVYGGLILFLVLIATMPGDVSIALIYGAVLGGFVMGTQSLLYGVAPTCYPTSMRGTGMGIAVCVGRVGSVAGPLLAAGLIGAGKTASQVLLGIVPLAFIGGVTAVFLILRLRAIPSAVISADSI